LCRCHNGGMRTITADRFKKNCLKVMREMSLAREPILITKKGRPLAKLVSADAKTIDDIFGCMKSEVEIVGDLVSPAVPLEDWDVLR